MPVYALIMAGGKGRRFGAYKQFIVLKDRVLLSHVVSVFEKCREIDQTILVVPPDKIVFSKKLMKNNGLSSVRIVAGGARRQDSVLNAIKTMGRRRGIAVIHDGVRPVVSPRLIKRGINLCKKHGAVIPGMPVNDTVKLVRSNRVIRTLDRRHLFLIQTPQFFDLDLLRKAYQTVCLHHEYTDEAAMLESIGQPVHVFRGDCRNIKITFKKDIQLIGCLL